MVLTSVRLAGCRAPTTGRSCGSRCPRSWRWWPSRCSCSRTRRSSVTSAPPELAGQGIAAVVLQTVVGLCIFLAYGTTASVARRIGAGDTQGALAQGIDGVWLAVLIGLVVTVLGVAAHRPAGGCVRRRRRGHGLRLDLPADRLPRHRRPLLVMLATTGVLRGLQDTRTPLVVAVARQRRQRRAQPASWSTASARSTGRASPAPRSAPCSRSCPARPRCSPWWCAARGASRRRCDRTCPASGPPPAPAWRW